ncbi:hypothetical protein Leryth_009149, partial [Lithospermum erythrorhizon]
VHLTIICFKHGRTNSLNTSDRNRYASTYKPERLSQGTSYVVVDGEGNEMLAVAFGSVVTPVTNTLQLFKVFKISNAELRVASPEYQIIGTNKLQWVLQRATLIRPMPLDEPNLTTLTREIVPFNMLADKLPKPGDSKSKIVSVDIMGLVILVTIPIRTPYGRELRIPVNLWDEMVTVVGLFWKKQQLHIRSIDMALNTIRAELENKEFLISFGAHIRRTRRISRLLLCCFFDESS